MAVVGARFFGIFVCFLFERERDVGRFAFCAAGRVE